VSPGFITDRGDEASAAATAACAAAAALARCGNREGRDVSVVVPEAPTLSTRQEYVVLLVSAVVIGKEVAVTPEAVRRGRQRRANVDIVRYRADRNVPRERRR